MGWTAVYKPHLPTAQGKIPHIMQGHTGGCTWEQNEQAGAWEADFVIPKNGDEPWFLPIWIIQRAEQNWSLLLGNEQALCLVPMIRRIIWLGELYVWEKMVWGIAVKPFEALSTLLGRRQWQPTPVLLPGKSHGRRSLVGCSPWGLEESDTTEQLHFHFSLSCTGEGNGNPLQCSCLESPRDGGAWWAAVYGVTQSRTRLQWLSSSSSSNFTRC